MIGAAIIAAAYIAVIGWFWRTRRGWLARRGGWLRGLGLCVFATAWAVFGVLEIASAVHVGAFFGLLAGPLLATLLGQRVFKKVVDICARQGITSISDFIAARYGKSRGLAALVTGVATVSAVPFLALQLYGLETAFAVWPGGSSLGGGPLIALASTVCLASAAMAFATPDLAADHTPSKRPDGGVRFVAAADGLLALSAFAVLAGAVLVETVSPQATPVVRELVTPSFWAWGQGLLTFAALSVTAAVATYCMPRMFHLAFLERPSARDIAQTTNVFPVALGLFAIVAAFVATMDSPLVEGAPALFLAGLSAAAALAVTSAAALSRMITNDIIIPLAIRWNLLDVRGRAAMDQVLITVRRTVIALLWVTAFGVHTLWPQNSFILGAVLAISGLAQLAPGFLIGLYWRRGGAFGAAIGVTIGWSLWSVLVLAPVMTAEAFQQTDVLFTVAWGAAVALCANIGAYVLTSWLMPASLRGRVQAEVFVAGAEPARADGAALIAGSAEAQDLISLAERYVGRRATQAALLDFERDAGRTVQPEDHADVALAKFAERLLSGVLGAASARMLVAWTVSGEMLRIEQALALLDHTVDTGEFNRDLVTTTLENITQGVSVVDNDMRLVAWNQAYLDLLQFPDGFVYSGRPIADLIRFNAERGEFGSGDVEAQVERRLRHLRAGQPHAFERVRPNGMVLKTLGNPLPGGGYVTTFTDVTEDRRRAQAIAEARDRLEERVAERTEELQDLARKLETARHAAEEANSSKTAFLAAASHDLLQPLNAARLFTGALNADLSDDAISQKRLAENIERSIASADRLLRALLDISRLDQGGLQPKMTTVDLAALFEELRLEFTPLANEQGLSFRIAPTSLRVRADRTLLRSVVQNFVSNALRYTRSGGVVLGARRHGRNAVRIAVADTGPGIPDDRLEEIFEEFSRLQDVDTRGEHGAGLGLAIVKRIARLHEAPVFVRSLAGRGSVFSIALPRVAVEPVKVRVRTREAVPDGTPAGLRILFVDDEPRIRDAMSALLAGWGCQMTCVGDADAALAAMQEADGEYDAVLADYHLSDQRTGLEVLDAFAAKPNCPALLALLTADQTPGLEQQVQARGVVLFRKPVDPARLRDALSAIPAAATV